MNQTITKNALALAVALACLPLAAFAQQTTDTQPQDASAQPAPAAPPAADGTAQKAPAKSVDLGAMMVTASPAATSKMSSSVSSSSLEPYQIEQSGAQGAADVLRDIPGIRAESSGGEGNANISVRGLPVASGGGKFVQFQTDGMPVLEYGDIAFATPDTFLRTDYNLDHVEVVRGGSASVFASDAPGAVFNFITKTGDVQGGNIGVTSGLNFDRRRLDFDYGMPVSDTTRFHLGGFLHDGQGPKTINYNAESGGQFMGNVTHDIDGGFLRLNVQYLDDKEPVFLPVPLRISGSNSNPSVGSLPGFDVREGALQSPYFLKDTAIGANGNRTYTNIKDGYRSKVKAMGGVAKFTLGEAWTLHEQFRIANNSGSFTGPYAAQVDTAQNIADSIGGPGSTLRYATGPQAGNVVADPATLSGNGLAQKTLLFNVALPNMNTRTNDIKLSRDFDLSAGTLSVLAGYYYNQQNIKQDWHWNQYVETVQGQDASLLDVYNAAGVAQTSNGLQAYGQPVFGNCCTRAYDLKYKTRAPYLSVTFAPGLWTFDAGLRYDHQNASGSYTAATPRVVDVNGDGIIQVPEQAVQVVDPTTRLPVHYTQHHLEYSFGANYAFTPDVAAFARASRGARFNADRLAFGGGLQPDGSASEGVAVNVVKQYEGGVKWSTRHTSLFVTGFYATTQEQNQDVTSAVATLISRDYKAKGVEVEGSVDYGDFSMRGGVTYTHSKITKDAITPANEGDVPQRQAKWIYQLSPSYRLGPVTVGATVLGTSDSYAANPNGLIMPGYTQVNTFVRWDVTDQLSTALYANNVFNAKGLTEVDQSPVAVQPNGLNTARSILGRTVYATLKYSF